MPAPSARAVSVTFLRPAISRILPATRARIWSGSTDQDSIHLQANVLFKGRQSLDKTSCLKDADATMLEDPRPPQAAQTSMLETLQKALDRAFPREESPPTPPALEDQRTPPDPKRMHQPRSAALDEEGLLLWLLAGLRLFHGPTPTWREAAQETRLLMVELAKVRCQGNITQMARLLGSSRRAVRDALRTRST